MPKLSADLAQVIISEEEIQERVQMQERLATVGQLAAGIAHDFNNIMAVIEDPRTTATRLEKALGAAPEIRTAQANVLTGKILVVFDPQRLEQGKSCPAQQLGIAICVYGPCLGFLGQVPGENAGVTPR